MHVNIFNFVKKYTFVSAPHSRDCKNTNLEILDFKC
jgi:hypothetical protein